MKSLVWMLPLAVAIIAIVLLLSGPAATSEAPPRTGSLERTAHTAAKQLPKWSPASDDGVDTIAADQSDEAKANADHDRRSVAGSALAIAELEAALHDDIEARDAQVVALQEELAAARETIDQLRERLHQGAFDFAQHRTSISDWAGESAYADVVSRLPDLSGAQTVGIREFLEANAARFREITFQQASRQSAADGGMTTIDMETGTMRSVHPDEIIDNTAEFLAAKDEYFHFFRSTLDPHQFTALESFPDRFRWALIFD